MADDIQSLPGETWKPVVGWELYYLVSDMGRVKSRSEHRRMKHNPKVLNPAPNFWGYSMARLNGGGRRGRKFVHHLVLEAFVGPRPEGTECCHGNGVRTDNRLVNLRWDTPKGNWADRKSCGQTHGGRKKAKISRATALLMRALAAEGATHEGLAARFCVPEQLVWRAVKGKTWREPIPNAQDNPATESGRPDACRAEGQ